MTSKQRAYLKSLAMNIDPVVHVGKGSLTPEIIQAADEALAARELIKVGLLQNCLDDIHEIANALGERTRSEVVQVIGRKIVLYREGKDDKEKIELPRAAKGRK
ncbi:MAG: ribosome assembly RNA-binding protein YhbY [Eubacterium sp.]|nr:ribosome assembly RNA-binding protein YhbY [Eubacterium sp.]